jgi:hypothetical protein
MLELSGLDPVLSQEGLVGQAPLSEISKGFSSTQLIEISYLFGLTETGIFYKPTSTLADRRGLVLIDLPPTQSRSNQPNSQPVDHQKGDSNPSALRRPFDKLFTLAFGNWQPGKDIRFLTVLFSKCGFTPFSFTHDYSVLMN